MIRCYDAPIFKPKLKEESLYLINRFQVRKSKVGYNAILENLNISLTRATEIEELHEDLDQYPKHYFNLTPFEMLNDKIDQNKFLTYLFLLIL